MIIKTDVAKNLTLQGKYKEALKIVKGFKLGYTKQDTDILTRGYECMIRPEFYRSLGKNPQECIDQAVELLKQKLGV